MTASIGVETMAMPRMAGNTPPAPAPRRMALETPSDLPRMASSGPQDQVDLRSDHIPVHLTLRAAEHRATSVGGAGDLTPEQQAFLQDLKARDREVRAHEQAHASVGGIYAGSPQYDYVTGPDGQRYAVGGQVKIDVSPVPDDPEATIEKMIVVKQAALAPREPSPQDRRVAQTADQHRQVAEGDLREMQAEVRNPALDEESPTQRVAEESLTSRLFTDASRLYREAADFLAAPAEGAETAVFA